ncbi:glycosyltransferase [Patescibacteria group bacterium]|nr:glycosyltransferase [Patescibacteria group bacterium]MBU1499831.1 glycosyltransferase [Patescibacteria group bacterium]
MKRVLKVGDKIYSQSLQHFVPSYLQGFPQREQFLLKHMKDKIKFDFSRHKVIHNVADVIRESKRLTKLLEGNSFDFIFVDNPFSALIIENTIKIPIIFDCIDWYDEMYLKEYGVDKSYYLLRVGLLEVLERASKVIVQSPIILESLKHWGLKTKDYTVIPNGFEKELFYPYPEKKNRRFKEKLSKKYKLDFKGKKIVVYTGKLSKWYENIKIIAEAIEDNQIFFVVGDGPLLNEIPNRANIIKVGAVLLSEVPKYTNIADVLVFPVDVDCSPIAISEYLAVGKPIVMGKGRMEWLLRNGRTGYMVDNNVNAWKKGILSAIQNKTRIKSFNLKLSKNLNWDYLAQKMVNFINKKIQ